MEYAIAKIIGAHFLKRQSCVLHGHAVRIDCFPLRIQYDDLLGNKVNDSPQLFSLLTELCLSVLETLWRRIVGVYIQHYFGSFAHILMIFPKNERRYLAIALSSRFINAKLVSLANTGVNRPGTKCLSSPLQLVA